MDDRKKHSMRRDYTTPLLAIQAMSAAIQGRKILVDISLEVQQGEIVAVVGPNGAGKTTLIRTISGFLQPTQGKVMISNQDSQTLSPKQRAQWIAVVPQARNLPGAFTVFQTVMMGRTPHMGWLGHPGLQDAQKVNQVLVDTQTIDLSERRIGELSGGEQQRILLARALAQNSPILLLDEPTAHLDLQYQSSIMSLVSNAAKKDGLAILLAAHDLNLVALYADRVAILVSGRITAIGTPYQVLTQQNIEAAYQVPVRVISHPDYGTPLILPDGHHPERILPASSIDPSVISNHPG
jgi:iron complex transport system ATP-binding protein